jgi:hypothetical protein
METKVTKTSAELAAKIKKYTEQEVKAGKYKNVGEALIVLLKRHPELYDEYVARRRMAR